MLKDFRFFKLLSYPKLIFDYTNDKYEFKTSPTEAIYRLILNDLE